MTKVEIKKLKEELDSFNVFSFFSRYGLDFLNSEGFIEAVYIKASEDTKFWLKHAPHNLSGDYHGERKS
jgi:hypothetical protein